MSSSGLAGRNGWATPELLLTSAGVKNPSIPDALLDLLGKPIGESTALCIPTAQYEHPMVDPALAWRFSGTPNFRCAAWG